MACGRAGSSYKPIGGRSFYWRKILAVGVSGFILFLASFKRSNDALYTRMEAKGDDDDGGYAIGSPAPSFSVRLTTNTSFSYDADDRNSLPMIIVSVDATDPWIYWMLTDNQSMTHLAETYPTGSSLLFAGVDIVGIELVFLMAQQWSVRRPDWLFAAETVPSELLDVLSGTAFKSPRYGWQTQSASGDRLDCFFEWCEFSITTNITLRDGGDACSDDFIAKADQGAFLGLDAVLVSHDLCDSVNAAALRVFEKAPGLSGVFVTASPAQPIGDYTSDWYSTFATTISTTDAEYIMQSADNSGIVSLDLTTTDVTGYFLGIQYDGALYNLGYREVQDARYIAWEGLFLEYLAKLESDDKSYLEVPIFDLDVLDDMTSNKLVHLPPFSLAARFETMEVVTALTCAGDSDSSCPKWDHCLTVLADCFDFTDSRRRLSEVGGADNELIRYVTPFRRNVGQWESDRSPLLPLLYPNLNENVCNITAYVTGGSWRLTTSIRLSDYSSKPHFVPVALMPIIFNDYDTDTTSHKIEFDSLAAYNANKSLSFYVANSITKVLLVATISGHGDCEFESTAHTYSINGVSYTIDFFGAGTMWGCDDTTYAGEIPNQAGTSNYGRDGWCDGAPVRMHSFDVTEAISHSSLNNLTYTALSYGDDDRRWYASVKHVYLPPTTMTDGCGGYMLVSAYLSFYQKI